MNFWSPYFISKRLQELAFRKQSGFFCGKVLDVGCGTMPYKKYLAACEYVGMDEGRQVRPQLLARAQEIPFSSEYFDGVLCTEVLEHLPDPEKAIKEIRRVLKKNGYLYLTVPQSWCLHYEPQDYFRFTKYGIRYLLEKNDFRVLETQRIGGIFSLVCSRIIDVSWQLIAGCLRPVCGLKWAERIASILCLPCSFLFYLLARICDNIEKADALGWAVLAMK